MPRLYTSRLSVVQGHSLPVLASFDGALGTASTGVATFEVVHVQDFTGTMDAPDGDRLYGPVSKTIPNQSVVAWNRDAVGYGWPEVLSIPVGSAWPLGLYAVVASGLDGTKASYFVVRPAVLDPEATIVFCWPWSTTVAYAGGQGDFTSLYDSTSPTRGRHVALQRPWDMFAFGEKRGDTHALPLKLWNFLLQEHQRVVPCTSFDLHNEPDLLDPFNLFVSSGHDEYWSAEMYERVAAFVARGGNAAFFSANTAWWRVRFSADGTVMICYKSSIEDPASIFQAVPTTSNTASSPGDTPENRLTGVSYRRGSQDGTATPYTIPKNASGDPFLGGVSGTTIPQTGPRTLLGFETDAADYVTAADGGCTPTGRDGTPLNFKILGAADLRREKLRLSGRATMGYYTNVGTVFTSGTINWGHNLDDPAVATITRNVIRILTKRNPQSPWTLLPRQAPVDKWTEMCAAPAGSGAITALFSGDLLLATDHGIVRRDAEDPSAAPQPTAFPRSSEITSLGTQLYSRTLCATTASGEILSRDLVAADDSAWTTHAGVVGATCLGMTSGSERPYFGLFDVNGERELYLCNDVGTPWERIGKPIPSLRAMAGWNTKLFAIAEDGRLYCRDSTPVDLVWAHIGDAPAGDCLGLGAYFDRLYALCARGPVQASTYTVQWRTALSQPTGIDAMLLFWRRSTLGRDTVWSIGTLSGAGNFNTLRDGRWANTFFDHIVSAGAGMLFLYNSTRGNGAIVTADASGKISITKQYSDHSFSRWSNVVTIPTAVPSRLFRLPPPFGGPMPILFYNKDSGHGVVGWFDRAGNFTELWKTSLFRHQWTDIVATWSGVLLFYQRGSGHTEWGWMARDGSFVSQPAIQRLSGEWDQIVPVGNRYLLFYRSDTGGAALAQLGDGVTSGPAASFEAKQKWVPAANGCLLQYDRRDGHAASGGFTEQLYTAFRSYPANAFASRWDGAVPVVGALPAVSGISRHDVINLGP